MRTHYDIRYDGYKFVSNSIAIDYTNAFIKY